MSMDDGKRRGCYGAIGCCESNKICGSLPHVVYVPLIMATQCCSCQPTCQKCEQSSNQAFAISNCKSCNTHKCQNCNSDEGSGAATSGSRIDQNDQYYKLCVCGGTPHFSKVSPPQIGLECQTDVCAGFASAPFCQCQSAPQNNRTLNVKHDWSDSGRHICTVRRRSSDDSGRVTWSDSGDSIFSDYQIADPIRRNNMATQTTTLSASRQRKISIGADVRAERRYKQPILDDPTLKVAGNPPNTDENSYSRTGHGDDTDSGQNLESSHSTKNTVTTEWNHPTNVSGANCLPKNALTQQESTSTNSMELTIPNRGEQKSISIRCRQTPRRSSSDWMLKKMNRATFKQRRSRLDSLQEQDIQPRRPRSKSLFVGAGRHPLILSEMEQPNLSASELTPQLDFMTWHTVKKTWNIGENSPDDIGKSYGLVAVPSMQGIAVTNTNDVKIKIYRTDGEKILAFGTPTWPNHGRGITRSNNGEHLIVCHISGVCTYALDGKLVNRYSHENTPGLFWGVACDNDGNHVVTDPKSSSIFIMTTHGDVIQQIGGEGATSRTNSNQSKRSRRGKKKNNEKQQVSGDGLNTTIDPDGDSPLTVAVSKMIGSNSDNEKKQVRLLAPRYVAVNSKNQILVTDTKQRCLIIMENDGTQLFTVGGGRSGCQRCRRPTDSDAGKTIQNVISTTTDFCIRMPMQSPTNIVLSPSLSNDTVFEQEDNSEPVAKYFAEICGNTVNCTSKSVRPKVFGAISRAQIGRGESVESQVAYQATPHKDSLKSKSKNPKEEWESHSSRVAYRLSSHMKEMSIDCDSYVDLTLDKEIKEQPASKHKMKIFRKSVKGMWKSKDRNKRKLGQSGTSKSDSLTSLSCDTSTGNEQPCNEDCDKNFHSPQVEIEQPTSSINSSDTDNILQHHSAPVTPHGEFDFSDSISPTTLDFDPTYKRQSDDSCSLDVAQEFDTDEDVDTSSCRKCHMGDPRGICVDKNDNILLADYARHRVSVFDPTGHFIRHLLTEKDGLSQPTVLCIIDNSTIAVKDASVGVKLFQFVTGD